MTADKDKDIHVSSPFVPGESTVAVHEQQPRNIWHSTVTRFERPQLQILQAPGDK